MATSRISEGHESWESVRVPSSLFASQDFWRLSAALERDRSRREHYKMTHDLRIRFGGLSPREKA